LSGLGFAAVLPQGAGAARKERDRKDDQDQKDSDANEHRNESAGDDTSGKDNNGEARAENDDTGKKDQRSDESDSGGGRDRNDNRNRDGDAASQADSEEDVSRRETRRQDEGGDSDKASRNSDDDAGDGGRRVSREFEQEVDEVPVEDVPATTPAAPANPNVVITDVPEVSDVDLVVEANPDVIASVSASGGFAFARSGGVTAVSGPDGASIIRTGDVTVDPTEPSDDGGNNDLDFSS
jgi:hypothetical protein